MSVEEPGVGGNIVRGMLADAPKIAQLLEEDDCWFDTKYVVEIRG